MKNKKRTEFDTLGPKKIDFDNLWGAQTQRSLENFEIGNEKMPVEIIKSIGLQKKAATQANMSDEEKAALANRLTTGYTSLTQMAELDEDLVKIAMEKYDAISKSKRSALVTQALGSTSEFQEQFKSA